MSPEQMDAWEDFDSIEPIGLGRLYELLAKIGVHATKFKDVEVSHFAPWLASS